MNKNAKSTYFFQKKEMQERINVNRKKKDSNEEKF